MVALFASTSCGYFGGSDATKFSAMMTTAIGVYPDADVRVLGVPVGKVDAVTPQGDLVRVDFHVDSGIQVPANANAAVVAPTVVADRYLQLSPIYTAGPRMPAGAVIPKERIASPAEFDDLLASAKKLSAALGPQGVNSDGALSQALTTAARNLQGNGQQLKHHAGQHLAGDHHPVGQPGQPGGHDEQPAVVHLEPEAGRQAGTGVHRAVRAGERLSRRRAPEPG
jgi:virulence factor Mce-like protein